MPNNEQVYIRPRRGTKTTMTDTEKSALVLKEGEIFFEFPDEGIGKGPAKVKIGDGVSAYVDLPYVLGNEAEYTYVDFIEERDDNPQLLINQIISGISISKFVANAKRIMQLLLNKFAEYLPISGGTIEGDLIVEGNVTAESQTIKSEATGSTTFVISNEQNDNVEVIVPDHSGTLALVSDFPISDDYDATSGSAMSGIAVNKALGTLDVTGDSNIAAGKTIKSWTEADGKVSITTQNISITKSQVSDFPTIGNGTLTLTKGSQTTTFTANQTGNASMVIPSALGDLSQNASYRTVSDTEKTTWNNKASTAVATQSANGLMSSGDKKKLDGIANGAEVNQNAYSKVILNDSFTLTADSKESTLKMYQGNNVSLGINFDIEGHLLGMSIDAKDEKIKNTEMVNSAKKPLIHILDSQVNSTSSTLACHDVSCISTTQCDWYRSSTRPTVFGGSVMGSLPTDTYNTYGIVNGKAIFFASHNGSNLVNPCGGLFQDFPNDDAREGANGLKIFANGDSSYYIKFAVQYTDDPNNANWGFVPFSGGAGGIKLGSPTARDGSATNRWGTLYTLTNPDVSSDRNLKEDITYYDDSIIDFLMDLKPVKYRWKCDKDEAHKVHYGLIAQDVEESMNKFGISEDDFGALGKHQKFKSITKTKMEYDESAGKEIEKEYIEDTPIEGEYEYSLAYDELISPMLKMLQLQQKEIDELKKQVAELSKK